MLDFTITTGAVPMGAYLTGADTAAPRPGIVLLQEIFGVNNAMRLAADQFAADGFVVLAPDLFHRIRPGIELGYSEAERTEAFGYLPRMDDATTLADVAAAVKALRAHPACTGKVAVLGFCMGGKYALLTAIAGGIDAAIAYYPVRVQDYADGLAALKCPTQAHVGDQDAHISDEARDILSAALIPARGHACHVYEGADHGFYNSVRSFGFHAPAAAASHERAVAFLRQHLG